MEVAMEKIMSLWQEGMVSDYCDAFEILLNKVDICEDYAVYLFISGLKPKISEVLKKYHNIDRSLKLNEAFSFARILEMSLKLDSIKLNQKQSIEADVAIIKQTESDEGEIQNVASVLEMKIETTPKVFDEMPKGFCDKIQEHSAIDEAPSKFEYEVDSFNQDWSIQESFDDHDSKDNEMTENFSNKMNVHVGLKSLYSTQNSHYRTRESMSTNECILYEGVRFFCYGKQFKWIDTGWGCNSECKGVEIIDFKIVVKLVDKNRVWEVGLIVDRGSQLYQKMLDTWDGFNTSTHHVLSDDSKGNNKVEIEDSDVIETLVIKHKKVRHLDIDLVVVKIFEWKTGWHCCLVERLEKAQHDSYGYITIDKLGIMVESGCGARTYYGKKMGYVSSLEWVSRNKVTDLATLTVVMVGTSLAPTEVLLLQGELTYIFGICLHVIPCLGGFVLPFACKLRLTTKGTSTTLYRNHDTEKHPIVAITKWYNGIYVSPTVTNTFYRILCSFRKIGSVVAKSGGILKTLREETQVKITVAESIFGPKERVIIFCSLCECDFDMKLMDIHREHFGISEEDYNSIVRMPSYAFASMYIGLGTIENTDVISVTKEGMTFYIRLNLNDEKESLNNSLFELVYIRLGGRMSNLDLSIFVAMDTKWLKAESLNARGLSLSPMSCYSSSGSFEMFPNAHANGVKVVLVSDFWAWTILKPPDELEADNLVDNCIMSHVPLNLWNLGQAL